MLGIFARPFNSLDESDLTELVEVRRIREHIHLDYKQQIKDHSDKSTVEMLADITAMANAQGGYIIIGVSEDKSEPDGTPGVLLGIEKGDMEVSWVQNVCLSSIEEKLIGLQVRDIRLSNGKSCVVIEVPNSLRKPHMIVYGNHRSFRLRHGRDKSYMGMQEVRNMILSMNMYRESLANFIERRKQVLRDYARGEPWLMLTATPIYVDTDKIDPLREDFRNLLYKTPGKPHPRYDGVELKSMPKPRLLGIESTLPESKPRPQDRYACFLRLMHNGHLEYCESFRHDKAQQEGSEEPIPVDGYRCAVILLHFLRVATQIAQMGEISEPIAVTMCLENFSPSFLVRGRKLPRHLDDLPLWEEPSLMIESIASNLANPDEVAHAIIGRLFNAFGEIEVPYFDSNGKFIQNFGS